MLHDKTDVPPREDQSAQLEKALMNEFFELRHLTPADLATLPQDELHRLMTEASAYASSKLAEVEARAHYVHDLHHND